MNILIQTERKIKKYLKDFKKNNLKRPDWCEVCGKRVKLNWHAKYMRNVITLCGIYSLPIKRLKCPFCGHTFALLPDFIEKYHRYSRDVIAFVLRKLKRFSYKEVADALVGKSEICIGVLTLYNWKKRFCRSGVL